MSDELGSVLSKKPTEHDAGELERQAREFIKTLGPFDAVRVDNHSVPISHLKVFTDSGREDGRLWMYDRKAPAGPKHLAPPIIAKEKGLYLIEHEMVPDDIPKDFVERILASHVEAPYPCLRNKLVFGLDVGILPFLADLERLQLALYMAVQQMRTAAHQRKLEWMGSVHATFDVAARLKVAQRGGAVSAGLQGMPPREIRKYIAELERGELRVVPPKEHWLGTFLQISFQMAPYIAALPWRLVRATGGVEFLTSDAPVVTVTRVPGHLDYSLAGGWANPTSETVFALSPTHVLAVGQSVNEDRVVGSADWCASVRDRTARNADRFVFARSADSRIGDLLASSAPPTPVVEFDGQQYTSGSPVGEVVKRLLDADHGTVVRWGPAR